MRGALPASSARPSVSSSSSRGIDGGSGRAGADGAAGSAAADATARSSHSATTSRAARQAASALAAPIRAASASRLEPLERGAGPRPSRGVLARRDRGRVTRVVVDPVDLGQPVARGRLEGVRIGRASGRPPGSRPGPLPWPRGSRADRPARTPSRAAASCASYVRWARAQGFRRGIGLGRGRASRARSARRPVAAPRRSARSRRVPGSSAPRPGHARTPSSPRPVRPSCDPAADRPAWSACPSGEGRAP